MATPSDNKGVEDKMIKESLELSDPLWDYFGVESRQKRMHILESLRDFCFERATTLQKLARIIRISLKRCHLLRNNAPESFSAASTVLEELWEVADDLFNVDRLMKVSEWSSSQNDRVGNVRLLIKELLTTLEAMCGLPLENLVQCTPRSYELISAFKVVKRLLTSIQTSITEKELPNMLHATGFISEVSKLDHKHRILITDGTNPNGLYNMDNSLWSVILTYEDIFQCYKKTTFDYPDLYKNMNFTTEEEAEYNSDLEWDNFPDKPPVFVMTARCLCPTLFHFQISHLEIDYADVRALGAKVKARGWFHRSILHMWHKVPTVMTLVRECGADVNAVDFYGRTPLMYAILSSDCHCSLPSKTKSLVKNIIPRDPTSSISPDTQLYLEYCSCTDHAAQIVGFLAYSGANLEIGDQDGVSAIHLAALSHPKVLQNLLMHSTLDKVGTILDNFGASPLHYAVYANNIRAVEMLLKLGLDADIRDDTGKTALDVAELLGFGDLREKLQSQAILRSVHRSGVFQVKSQVETELWLPYRIRVPEPTEPMWRNAKIIGPKVMLERIKSFSESDFNSILNSTFLGSRQLEEVKEIESEVTLLVEKLSQGIKSSNPKFAFSARLCGSSAERTKVGFPDEFNFNLIMLNIDNPLDLELTASADYYIDDCYIEIEPWDNGNDCVLFHCAFAAMMARVLNDPILWSNFKLKMGGIRIGKFGPVLTLHWNGGGYKHLKISLDLVPSFPIKDHPFIPLKFSVPVDFSGCELYHLITANKIATTSYSDMEAVLMKLLPDAAIEAYKLAKAMRSIYISRTLVPNDRDKKALFADRASSYRMKNLLLMEYSDVLVKQIDASSLTKREWLERMFRRWRDNCTWSNLLRSVCGDEPLESVTIKQL